MTGRDSCLAIFVVFVVCFFSRMGGIMRYATADNWDFLLALVSGLERA